MENEKKKLLSIGEASEYLGVSIDTLRRWEKKGKVESYRSPGNHRYFVIEDLDKLFGKKYMHDALRKSSEIKEAPEIKGASTTPIAREPVIETHEKPQEDTLITTVSHMPTAPTPTPRLQECILDRPTREVKIPEIEMIKVIREEEAEITENGIQTMKTERVETSILTPSDAEAKNVQELQGPAVRNIDSRPAPSEIYKKQVEKKPKAESKVFLYAVITLTILIVIAAIFFFIGLSSQPMLSPVP